MSEMSSSEKPEFCFPTRRGSRTFWVAVGGLGQPGQELDQVQGGAYLAWARRRPLGATQAAYAAKQCQIVVLEGIKGRDGATGEMVQGSCAAAAGANVQGGRFWAQAGSIAFWTWDKSGEDLVYACSVASELSCARKKRKREVNKKEAEMSREIKSQERGAGWKKKPQAPKEGTRDVTTDSLPTYLPNGLP